MKTNKQKDIKVNKSGFKRSRFNWTHDVNTTFNWGEIQPTQCKLLIPNSKTTMSAQSLIRLAPMVAPTFGRVKYKTFNQFVALSEIFPNFDAMMAQEPKSTSVKTKVPQAIPTCSLAQLSYWVLHGARATIYFAQPTLDGQTDAQNAANGYYVTSYRKNPNGDLISSDVLKPYLSTLVTNYMFTEKTDPYNSTATGLPNVGKRVVFDPSCVKMPGTFNTVYEWAEIPLGLVTTKELFPVDRGYTSTASSVKPVVPDYMKEVTMEDADYVIEGWYAQQVKSGEEKRDVKNAGEPYFAIAFELSDSGKRLRKIFQGCGYQIDFTARDVQVSILPLLAQFKAYFDIFGLQLYQGWETTSCAKFIQYIEQNFVENVTSALLWDGSLNGPENGANSGIFMIMKELLNEWYTEDPDYIGAHMEKLAVSPNVNTTGFISVDVNGVRTGAHISNTASTGADGVTTGQQDLETTALSYNTSGAVHSYIDNVYHGEVDAELLKRMYKWVNRNSILGREIAKILRAQNLGKYVDECKSNFIGSSDVMVTISDVISQAATEDAVLGEYGGRGLQYDSTDTLVFENDAYGYWVTLATIIPEAGYTQGIDPTLLVKDKFNFYNPDFDALGMEITPKRVVVGTNYISGRSPDAQHSDKGFGFIPRYSKFKVAQNLVNGDFNRHNRRNTYMPYTLDKQINCNDFDTIWSAYTDEFATSTLDSTSGVKIRRSGRWNNLPVAGNVWRMPTKYAWMGNFDRIFYNIGKKEEENIGAYPDSWLVGFDDYNDDNFLSHGIYDVKCYAPMKPIEDSYGLDDDEADHAGAEFVTKA